MTLTSHNVETSVVENLRSILDEASGEVLAVNFDEQATSGLVETLFEMVDPPSVRLLAEENVLKWLREDFMLASAAAELIEAKVVRMRTSLLA